MPQKEPLFDLIEQLSASEKRYFSLFSQSQPGTDNPEYLDLFRILEKMPHYDEARVVEQIKNPVFAKNISSGKNYLYNLVLKSLRSYHSEQRALFKVYGLLQDVHILIEKNLIAQAAKRLHKAQKIAAKFHLNLPYLELLILDRQMIRSYQQKQADTLIQANQLETQSQLDQVSAQFDILTLYDKTFLAIRNKMQLHDPEGSVRDLLKDFSAKVSINALSFDTRMTYHLLWANYYLALKGETDNALLHMKNILDLFEDDPHLIGEYTSRYINVVNNYLNIFFLQKDFSPFPHFIKALGGIKPRSEYLKIKLFETIYSLKLMALLGQRLYPDALEVMPLVIQGLNTYGKKMQPAFLLEFYQNIALTYFHSNDKQSALDWLNKIAYGEKQEIRQDIQAFCKTLQLLSHYDLGNHDLAESLARSITRSPGSTHDELLNKLVAKAILKVIPADLKSKRLIFAKLRSDLEKETALSSWKEEILYWLERTSV